MKPQEQKKENRSKQLGKVELPLAASGPASGSETAKAPPPVERVCVWSVSLGGVSLTV